MKNAIIEGISVIAILLMFTSVLMLEGDDMIVPSIMFVVGAAWMTIVIYANCRDDR